MPSRIRYPRLLLLSSVALMVAVGGAAYYFEWPIMSLAAVPVGLAFAALLYRPHELWLVDQSSPPAGRHHRVQVESYAGRHKLRQFMARIEQFGPARIFTPVRAV